MSDLNDLLVRIDATTEQLRREMRRADQVTQQGSQRIDRSLQRVDRGFDRVNAAASRARAAVGTVISVLAIRRIGQYVQESVALANTIDKTARSSALTTDEVQELRFAFGQLAELADGQIDRALAQFNVRLGQARRGNAALVQTFEALDVRLDQHTRPALDATLRAMAQIRDPAQRSELAVSIFGDRAGPQLAAALDDGIESLDKLRAQLHDDGGVISADNVQRAAELNDVMDRLNRKFAAERTEAILENAEALERLAEAMSLVQRAGIGAIAGLTRFGQFLGEEVAARLGGVSDDDIPRLMSQLDTVEQRAQDIRDRLERENPLFRGRRHARMRDQLAELEEEANRIRGLIDRAQTRQVDQRLDGAAPDLADMPTFVPQRAEVPDIDILPLIDPNDPRIRETERFWQSTRTEVEQLEAQMARVQELADQGFFRRAGIDDQEVLGRLQDQLDAVQEKTESVGARIAESLALTAGGALEDMFARGELSAGNFAEAVLRDLARIMAQLLIIQPLIEGMFTAMPGFSGGSLSIPGFATGGSFKVPGSGGADSKLVPLRLTPGERVTIQTPAQQARASGGNIQVVDQRGASAPPIEISEMMTQAGMQQRLLIRSEFAEMAADGSFDRVMRGSGYPIRRSGRR